MRRSIPLVVASIVLVAMPHGRAQSPTPSQPGAARRLIIQPREGTLLRIEAIYPQPRGDVCEFKRPKPLRAVYRGRLTVELNENGSLRLVNTLSFDNYLRGLAEVPLSWPTEALRAQIIAARSYALDAYNKGRGASSARGYDICSTDACQVYRGAAVELGAFGERWVRAVGDTRGRVLTYNDRVIQAFYFSTSTGRTLRAFPGGTPQPWLPGVSGEDGDAPLANWTARVRLADLGPILRADGLATGTVRSVARSGDDIRVTTTTGARTISVRDFRVALNNEGPCLYPSRYPDPSGTADGNKLPQTVPSTTFSMRTSGATLIISGRGWGHGVGMSQYGARSLAERGRTAAAILKHFYGPARLERIAEPASLRVLAADGLRRVRIAASGPVTVRTETGSVLAPSRRFEVLGGEALRVRRGIGPTAEPVLTVASTTGSVTVQPGIATQLTFELSRSARVRLEVRQAGTVIAQTDERSVERGTTSIAMPTQNAQGASLQPGTYQAVLSAFDGLDRVRSAPVDVTLLGASPSPSPEAAPPTRDRGSASPPLVALIGALGGVAVVAALLLRARRASSGGVP